MKTETHGGNIYKIEEEYGYSLDEILDYSANINPIGLSPKIEKTIMGTMDLLLHYPDPQYRSTCIAIAKHHGIPVEYIIPGNGATELIFLYCRVRKPKKSLILSPTFSEYEKALRESGSEIVLHELREKDGFIPDFDEIISEINSSFDLVTICNPNNPTGVLCDREDILKLSKHCESTGTQIMIDESFLEFRHDEDERTVISENQPGNLFILRSMTKIFAMPGLRMGYAVTSDKKIAEEINSAKEPWTINIFAARVAEKMIEDSDYLMETRDFISDEIEYIKERLKEIDWLKSYPPTVNYFLARIENGLSAQELRERMIKDKVLIRDASNFHFLDDSYVRFAIKDRKSNERLIEVLKEV